MHHAHNQQGLIDWFHSDLEPEKISSWRRWSCTFPTQDTADFFFFFFLLLMLTLPHAHNQQTDFIVFWMHAGYNGNGNAQSKAYTHTSSPLWGFYSCSNDRKSLYYPRSLGVANYQTISRSVFRKALKLHFSNSWVLLLLLLLLHLHAINSCGHPTWI